MLAEGPMYDSLGRGNPDLVSTPYGFYDIWNTDGYTWQTTPDLRRADKNKCLGVHSGDEGDPLMEDRRNRQKR